VHYMIWCWAGDYKGPMYDSGRVFITTDINEANKMLVEYGEIYPYDIHKIISIPSEHQEGH